MKIKTKSNELKESIDSGVNKAKETIKLFDLYIDSILEIYDAHKVDELSNSILNHILASSIGKVGIIAISKPTESILMKEWVSHILELAPLSKNELIQCLDTKLGCNDFINSEIVTCLSHTPLKHILYIYFS